ncbi:MAG: hypothetical protein HC810_01265, partial [Acaryochloridaceae cyanobacterium RL_2_7]|nr:hypothetical protein [Acaryochloridaceae cyanobacterium RL_2_7]
MIDYKINHREIDDIGFFFSSQPIVVFLFRIMPRENQLPDAGILQFSRIVQNAIADSGLSQREFAKEAG